MGLRRLLATALRRDKANVTVAAAIIRGARRVAPFRPATPSLAPGRELLFCQRVHVHRLVLQAVQVEQRLDLVAEWANLCGRRNACRACETRRGMGK